MKMTRSAGALLIFVLVTAPFSGASRAQDPESSRDIFLRNLRGYLPSTSITTSSPYVRASPGVPTNYSIQTSERFLIKPLGFGDLFRPGAWTVESLPDIDWMDGVQFEQRMPRFDPRQPGGRVFTVRYHTDKNLVPIGPQIGAEDIFTGLTARETAEHLVKNGYRGRGISGPIVLSGCGQARNPAFIKEMLKCTSELLENSGEVFDSKHVVYASQGRHTVALDGKPTWNYQSNRQNLGDAAWLEYAFEKRPYLRYAFAPIGLAAGVVGGYVDSKVTSFARPILGDTGGDMLGISSNLVTSTGLEFVAMRALGMSAKLAGSTLARSSPLGAATAVAGHYVGEYRKAAYEHAAVYGRGQVFQPGYELTEFENPDNYFLPRVLGGVADFYERHIGWPFY
jgi:hypothetical protein